MKEVPILFEKKSLCCGCTACMAICPKQAIIMEIDFEGFLYPKINVNLCCRCNKCKEVCPIK